MKDKISLGTRATLLMIVAAYIFSFMLRMIWIYQVQGNEQFMWDGQFMISTGDGYYFASGAQKWLEHTLEFNPRVPDLFYTATVTLTAFVTKYTALSLNTVILYMPAVISSLVVIPIILIGRLFNMTTVGLFSALLGSIAWSYYNRTMVGYFDTDMFSAMAPMFILYFLLATIKTEKRIYALLSAFAFLIYPFLYDQGKTIVYAMGLLYMGYMLLFHRKDDFTYRSILLITVGLIDFNFWGQLSVMVALYIAMEKNFITVKQAIYGSIILIPIFLYTGNVHGLILGKMANYFERGTVDKGLKFLQVSQTIREAGLIPFNVMADRISGSIVGVLIAFVGYILLVLRYREFILALPLIAIALFSLVGGLRFTVYAVPMAAISAIYLFHFLILSWSKEKKLYYPMMTLLSLTMIYPNITHIIDYRVPTVMSKREVKALDTLKQHSSPKDFVVTWWDYGYPIWYYGDKNTLIDGGKHNNDNYIVSKILLSTSPILAAKLSRLSVETYVSSNYQLITNTLFKNNTPQPINVQDYLDELQYTDKKIPKKTREIYLYMPWNMMGILPTIRRFSDMDLNSGKREESFFYLSQRHKKRDDILYLGQGLAWLIEENKIMLNDKKIDIGRFIVANYDSKGEIKVQQKVLNRDGKIHIIYMPAYDSYLVLDDAYLNSLYIQMFVFEHYDKNLFEPVILDPLSKIYRLKI